MAINNIPNSNIQEMSEMRSRLDWLDEQRRQSTRKLAELEQRVIQQEQETTKREQRIKELEQRISNLTAQLSRMPQIDTRLSQFKEEMLELLEQYDQRGKKASGEAERLRRVEHEVHTREIADIRRELPALTRIQQELDIRAAEDTRLSQLIGLVQNQIPALRHEIEPLPREIVFVNEATKRHATRIGELETAILEINKKWEPIHTRQDIIGTALARVEVDMRGTTEAQTSLRDAIKAWTEQIQLGEYERTQRLNTWERIMKEQQGVMEQYAKQWVGYADQYQEAKMALQSIAPWQKQQEQKQREELERNRVEVSRTQAQWQTFQTEHEKKWRNLELDTEQRLASISRRDSQYDERFAILEESLVEVKQDKEMLWRVQSAQADALKQWPRIWIEEVEKTIAQNPNRRRQPALVPVREE